MLVAQKDLFPCPVWVFDVPNPDGLNADLIRWIADERRRDSEGLSGKSQVLGWHSADDLHLRPEFDPFLRVMADRVGDAVRAMAWDLSRLTPAVIGCWAVVNPKHASNHIHTHPGSFLSGVYYLATPPDCGRLFFVDPRAGANMAYPLVSAPTRWGCETAPVEPAAGRMVVFPSWLPHGVEPNRSDAERICLSFNVGARLVETG